MSEFFAHLDSLQFANVQLMKHNELIAKAMQEPPSPYRDALMEMAESLMALREREQAWMDDFEKYNEAYYEGECS